jgi:hypothetical protein
VTFAVSIRIRYTPGCAGGPPIEEDRIAITDADDAAGAEAKARANWDVAEFRWALPDRLVSATSRGPKGCLLWTGATSKKRRGQRLKRGPFRPKGSG